MMRNQSDRDRGGAGNHPFTETEQKGPIMIATVEETQRLQRETSSSVVAGPSPAPMGWL
jgi:hypothetical protein